MGRRRFVQINGELVEITNDVQPTSRDAAAQNGLLWNDRSYQDMNDPRFNSRTSHREYMKAAGLTTTDDFKGTWRTAEKNRIAARQATSGFTRQEIARSIEKLQSGYKPRLRSDD